MKSRFVLYGYFWRYQDLGCTTRDFLHNFSALQHSRYPYQISPRHGTLRRHLGILQRPTGPHVSAAMKPMRQLLRSYNTSCRTSQPHIAVLVFDAFYGISTHGGADDPGARRILITIRIPLNSTQVYCRLGGSREFLGVVN